MMAVFSAVGFNHGDVAIVGFNWEAHAVGGIAATNLIDQAFIQVGERSCAIEVVIDALVEGISAHGFWMVGLG
jgi:hypothetical protein